jgi:hypothetical protein
VKPRADRVLAELEAARNDPVPKIVNDCPVRIIREVKDDGTDVYLGDVYIDLAAQPWELEGSGKEEQTVPLRNPSNPDIWTVGGTPTGCRETTSTDDNTHQIISHPAIIGRASCRTRS